MACICINPDFNPQKHHKKQALVRVVFCLVNKSVLIFKHIREVTL